MCAAVVPAFDYLENRLLGLCQPTFSCQEMYELCRLVQAFDPAMASQVDAEWVDALCNLSIFPNVSKAKLKVELTKYQSLADKWTVDHDSVATFSTQVSRFWVTSASEIKEWAEAARVVFTLSPNSAGCERVFSTLSSMFGGDDRRNSALADVIQAAMMLRCNKNQVYWDDPEED